MLCGIHFFITKLKTKIDVIILSRFKFWSSRPNMLVSLLHLIFLRPLFLTQLTSNRLQTLAPRSLGIQVPGKVFFVSILKNIIYPSITGYESTIINLLCGPMSMQWCYMSVECLFIITIEKQIHHGPLYLASGSIMLVYGVLRLSGT